jgi:cold shock CspA family protein
MASASNHFDCSCDPGFADGDEGGMFKIGELGSDVEQDEDSVHQVAIANSVTNENGGNADNNNTSNRIHGVVLRWHATKGFGTIHDDYNDERYFVHWTALRPFREMPVKNWMPVLQTGESVEFVPGTNDQQGVHFGKPQAFEVTGAFGRPLMCDWITIPSCKYRGDPRQSPNRREVQQNQ